MSGRPSTLIGERVVQAVTEVLGVSPQVLGDAQTLFDVPGFDSLSVVAILDCLEAELGVEIPPEAIVPEAFESLGSLIALFQAPGGQA